MARIQILPLTTIRVGDTEHTPFVILFDQVGEDEGLTSDVLESIRHQTNAAAVWSSANTMDAPQAAELTDEQRESLLTTVLPDARLLARVSAEQLLGD